MNGDNFPASGAPDNNMQDENAVLRNARGDEIAGDVEVAEDAFYDVMATIDEFDPDYIPSIFEQYSVDEDAAENGKWFDFDLGVEVKIRRFTSKHSQKVRAALEKPLERRRNPEGMFSDEDNQQLLVEQLVRSVIVDWRGQAFRNPDGTPIEYSQANVRKLVTAYPDFRLKAARFAAAMDSYRADELDTTVKN